MFVQVQCNISASCALAECQTQPSRSLPPLNKHTGLNARSPGERGLSEVVYVGTEEGSVVRQRGRPESGRKEENEAITGHYRVNDAPHICSQKVQRDLR